MEKDQVGRLEASVFEGRELRFGDTREAGRRGARNAQAQISETREALLARAGEIGHGAARIAMGEEKASSQEVAMIRDVLDRILGHSTARVEVATFDGFEEDFAALIAEMNRQP